MPLPLRDMRPRDRGAYYGDTVVFHKETQEPYYVLSFDREEDTVTLCSFRVHNKPEASRHYFTIHIDVMQEDYTLYRPRLGWRNVSIGCMFGTASPGRGYKKGHVASDVRCVSPIFTGTYSLIERMHNDFNDTGGVAIESEAIEEFERSMKRITDTLGTIESLRPRSYNYLTSFSSAFVSKARVQDMLSGNYLGVAITPNWAVIQLPNNSRARAAVYYQDRVVGSMDLESGRVSFFSGCSELEHAWNRLE